MEGMNTILQPGALNTPLTRNAYDAGYVMGLLAIPVTILIIAVVAVIVSIKNQKKVTKNPRAEKDIKKELRKVLNSEDGKVGGLLLAWCIFTGCYIILGISGNVGEFSVWLQGLFILALLIMAIKGRGRWFIVITSSLFAIMLLGYGLGSQSSISRISGAIGGSFYGITALYFAFSKRAKKHFAWGKRQAELWRELEARDKLGESEPHAGKETEHNDESKQEDNESDDEDDIRELLKELKEQNKKLADKIDKLEKDNKATKEKLSDINSDDDL